MAEDKGSAPSRVGTPELISRPLLALAPNQALISKTMTARIAMRRITMRAKRSASFDLGSIESVVLVDINGLFDFPFLFPNRPYYLVELLHILKDNLDTNSA